MSGAGQAPLGGLASFMVYRAVADALAEDLGRAGDITTDAIVPREARAEGVIAARKAGIIAGLQFAEAAFKTFDHDATVEAVAVDGAELGAGDVVARVHGRARALLTAERTALNFLGHLSGIATLTHRYVAAIAGTGAHVCGTRKTTPGLRAFEKYAIRMGGGANHRFGLDDAVLIKDNHIVIAGGVGAAIRAAKAHAGHMVKVEVEVDSLDQLEAALAHGPDAVLLDNMEPEMLAEAVRCVRAHGERHGRAPVTEASGGVTLDTVRAIAETGVDLISVGALTHSAPVLDLGLDFAAPGA